MSFQVFRDPQQSAGFVICLVTIPICIAATILRFVATSRARRKIGYEDGFALAALIFFLVYTLIFLYREFPQASGHEAALLRIGAANVTAL